MKDYAWDMPPWFKRKLLCECCGQPFVAISYTHSAAGAVYVSWAWK